MQKWFALLLISAGLQAQDRTDLSPLDARTWGVVLEDAKTRDVIVKKDVPYLEDEKGSLHIDIYQPPDLTPGEVRPAVIFLNGIGEAPEGLRVKDWAIYSSWPRLIAAHGMIGISMETDGKRVETSFEALFHFLAEQGTRHHVDAKHLGVYAASANVSTTLPWLMSSKAYPGIQAAVLYYGAFLSGPYRKDLPVLFVVAEHDVPRNHYADLWSEILKYKAPWTLSMGAGLPHAFDGFEDSDDSRRLIRQTISFWKDHLETLPARTQSKSPGREILSAMYGHDDQRLITLLTAWVAAHDKDARAWFEYAAALKNQRRYEESERAFRKVLELEPENVRALTYTYLLLYQLNRIDEAAPFLTAAEKIGIDLYTYAGMGYTMYSLNRHQDGVKFFEKSVAITPTPNNLYNLACGYARLGEKDKALTTLEQSIAVGYTNKEHLQSDTDLAPLHDDPRFEKLMRALSPAMPPPVRAHHALVYDAKNKNVLMTNGSTPLNGGQSFKFFNDLWRFDGVRWTEHGTAGDERSGVRLVYNSRDQKIYAFGGYLANGESSGQLRVLDGNSWRVLADHPDMKATEAGFVYDAGRNVLVAFGGSSGRNEQSESTWEWDGKTWKNFSGTGPGKRNAFVMVYDEARKKTTLFGGHGDTPGGYLGDTWTFDGKSWKQVATEGPEPRLAPGYAYDTKRGLLYLFGGIGDHKVFGDTWCWNGKTWKKLSDSGPTPRSMGYMAYDEGRDRIVLFGGRPQWPDDASDTWEWDGRAWHEVRQ